MVTIIADSTSDLSHELIQKYNIQIVPLSVFIGNKNYLDGIEITSEKLLELVDQTKEFPKTSAPSVESFQQMFSKFNDLVYIGISSQLSASFQSSLLALEGSDPTRKVGIDSLNLSTGIGLLVIRAAEMAQHGDSVPQIAEQIKKDVAKVHTSFVIDTLDFLYKGGRCSAVELLAGSILKIRPMIEVKSDGTLGVREKLGGSRKKAILTLVTRLLSHRSELDTKRVFITHCVCIEDAEFLKNELAALQIFEEILITEAGSTIASHCGPKTIGILYMTK